jgi:DNA-binding NarL/FixJ family response regulator
MKVLIADDHVLFREGVRMVLEDWAGTDLDVVEAGSYTDVYSLLETNQGFDVALIDLWMPGANGFAGIEAVRTLIPSLRIIVVSAFEEVRDVRRVLSAGANGFIGKSSPSAMVTDAITRVMAGETFVSPSISLDVTANRAKMTEPEKRLTQRQREVLHKLQEGKSNKEIARELGLAEITVKLHVTAILRTFNAENRTQVVVRTSLAQG